MNTPIYSIHNHYHGINAHLNSLLQADDWEEFHSSHISSIQGVLNKQLLRSGYVARLEKGLQIKLEGKTQHPESDVLIEDYNLPRAQQGQPSFPERTYLKPFDVATTVITPDEVDTEYFSAVVLYHHENSSHERYPVAWIELLSPTNKQRGRHYLKYLVKREALLATKTWIYIEIDYLHRTSPTLYIRDYAQKQANAKPYHVALIDTRKPHKIGGLIEFGVDEKIPDIPIPLHGDDLVDFHLNEAYQHSFEWTGFGLLGNLSPNYAEKPVDFETYSLSDQAVIAKRMAVVQELAQKAKSAGAKDLDDYIKKQDISIPV